MTDERAAPPWLADAARAAWHEVRAYAATAAAIARPSRGFVVAWWRGEADAPNPLAMLATGAALCAAARQLAGAVLGVPHADTLLEAVLSALGPYVHYVLIGLLCHAVMRPLGRRKPHVLDTIAITLYAGSGPAAIAEAAAWLVACALGSLVSTLLVGAVLGVAFAVFCSTLSAALGSLHRGAWWHVFVALFFALIVSGLLFGLVRPPGYYGLHWVIYRHGGWRIGLGF